MKTDKTEDLRLDLFHDAPLPNDEYKTLTFRDCSELEFYSEMLGSLIVTGYDVERTEAGHRLVVQLDLKTIENTPGRPRPLGAPIGSTK